MIFRKYRIYANADPEQVEPSVVLGNNHKHYDWAAHFLLLAGVDFFPTISFEESDNVSDDLRECLKKMFFLSQLRFASNRGWMIKVVECGFGFKHEELFGSDLNMDIQHAEELGIETNDTNKFLKPEMRSCLVSRYLYNLGPRNFWVVGFTSKLFIIHTTRQKVSRKDSMYVKV